jgi:hypothetical protein
VSGTGSPQTLNDASSNVFTGSGSATESQG